MVDGMLDPPGGRAFPNVTRIAERSADWAVAKSGGKNLGGLKPRQFRFEFEAQLRRETLSFRPDPHASTLAASSCKPKCFPHLYTVAHSREGSTIQGSRHP